MIIRYTLRQGKAYADHTDKPLQISVTYQGKRFRKNLIKIHPRDWDAKNQRVKKSNHNYLNINRMLSSKRDQITEYIITCENTQHIPDINAVLSDRHRQVTEDTVGILIEDYMESLYHQGKYSSYIKVKSVLNKIRRYTPADVHIKDLTVEWFEKYMHHCIADLDNKKSTIVKDLKTLKTAINRKYKPRHLPDNNILDYSIKIDKPRRQALTTDELLRLKGVTLTPYESLFRDMFMFAVYSRGMRIRDVLHIKTSDIEGDTLYYRMSKSRHRISIRLVPAAIDIVRTHSGPDYLFPLMTDESDPIRREYIIKSRTALVNKYLKVIAHKAAIDKNLSTHIARHTFAALADRQGIPVTAIQQLLGHTSLDITKHYLADLRSSSELDDSTMSIFRDLDD